MEIASITNKNTNDEVCSYYLHKKLNIDKTEIEVGKRLKIVYDIGSFFTHENVVSVEYPDEVTIRIETVKKVWILQGGEVV